MSTEEVSESTRYRRRKNRLQLQISNCRRMLRAQAEKIAGINDPQTFEALQIILELERKLTAIEFGLTKPKTEDPNGK